MLGISVSIILGAVNILLLLALDILLCVWVYRDAQHRGMIGILWAAVALLVPSCIGVIVYLIVRLDHNKVTCSNCNTSVNGKEKFCSNCGMELSPTDNDDTVFQKSQKNILIAFFSCMAATVICGIMMVATMVAGTVNLVGDAAQWVAEQDWAWEADWDEFKQDLEDVIGDVDLLFDEGIANITVEEDEVTITSQDGEELLYVDGSKGIVEINVDKWKELCDKYGIQYDETMTNEEVQEQMEKALKNQQAIEEESEAAREYNDNYEEQRKQLENQVKKSVEDAVEDALGVDIIDE